MELQGILMKQGQTVHRSEVIEKKTEHQINTNRNTGVQINK